MPAQPHGVAPAKPVSQISRPYTEHMTSWLSEREQEVWRKFLAVSLRFPEELSQRLEDRSGLALTDYEILVLLSEADDRRLRMSEVAEGAIVSRSRLTYRVDKLVERGFISREPCADDGRGLWAILTDEGFAVLEGAAPGHVADVRELMLDHLSEDDLDQMNEIVDRLGSKLQ